jgi:hypothetical protein
MYTQPTKHQYRPIDNIPNSVVELDHDYNRSLAFAANDLLVQLTNAVRRSRPHWKYKADARGRAFGAAYTDNTFRFSRLQVFDGDEKIGEIWLDQKYARGAGGLVPTYCVTNVRIDRALARKRHQETTKLQVAAKHMVKSFYSKTTDEVVREAARPASVVAHNIVTRRRNGQASSIRDLAEATMDFAMAHEEAFSATLTQSQRAQYSEVKAFKADEADVIKFQNSDRYVFLDRGGGKFIRVLVRPNNDIVSSDEVTLEQMPDPTKLSLSILKLQDPDDDRFVVGHGVRIGETTFVIGA